MFNFKPSLVPLLIISLIVPCQSIENQGNANQGNANYVINKYKLKEPQYYIVKHRPKLVRFQRVILEPQEYSKTTITSEDWKCQIEEIRGFLKYVCSSQDGTKTKLKCHNSAEMYKNMPDTILQRLLRRMGEVNGQFSGELCSNDPRFYQACQINPKQLSNNTITNDDLLCGQYICKTRTGSHDNIGLNLDFPSIACNNERDCDNTDWDEKQCSSIADDHNELTLLPSGKSVPTEEICDDVCFDRTCEDEAVCNGYTYGVYCDFNSTANTSKYVPVLGICDEKTDCVDGADENNCNVNNSTLPMCSRFKRKIRGTTFFHARYEFIYRRFQIIIPVHNFTRCYVTRLRESQLYDNFNEYCDGFIPDQTNCTDPDKAALVCKVDGYISTVSKHMVCLGKRVCDDNFENNCVQLPGACFVHKHFMCDGEDNCDNGADEKQRFCKKITKEKCRRRVEKKPSKAKPIPLIWLNDGVKDCVDGRDETSGWTTCGKGMSLRFVNDNRSCENVFVCPWENPSYVELDDLCDGIETCGNENEVCSESLGSPSLFTVPLTTDKGLSKHFSFCMKGLKETQNFMKNCTTMHSFFFPDGDVFGVSKTNLTLPANLQDCDHMFGEMYIYTSCTNKCINSSCPLDSQKNLPRYEVCPGQYPDRIGTIVDNSYLIFVTKTFGNIFTNNYFVCHNKLKCIDYSKVCDLVSDCGDDSDEKNCSNHFQCKLTSRYIPKTRKCDGRFDCLDLSDECNDQCSSYIVKHSALKGLSWLIGILATLANLTIITKNIATLKRCRTTVALFNKALILAISFGDLLVGCYLIVISVYDGIIYKGSYCKNQIDWITSTKCSMIGVLSTLGSQLSLFAMCILSATRFVGIRNSMKVPGEVTLVKSLQVTASIVFMILSSLSIAAVPIIGRFEDFFVNGVRYPEDLKIFAGTPNKQKFLAILEAYYGRMKKATLSWRMIREMVNGMYSRDFVSTEFAYPDHTASVSKVDFYGNDGVCLFKYFVKNQDPQRNFVWTILALNFTCFVFISVSYMVIGYISHRSSKSLTQSGANQLISQRNRKMNRKISIIILTDFLCWIPFIVTCILHSIEVLDATPWYSLFSIIILPINSVINPLIYDDTISSLINSPIRRFGSSISEFRVIKEIGRRFERQTTGETIELENMNTT